MTAYLGNGPAGPIGFGLVIVTAVLALRPHLWRLWDNVVEWVTCPPGEDVLGEVEDFERGRVFR